MDAEQWTDHDGDEPQLLMPRMDEETSDLVIAEINRREALGLPGVPGGDWDD